MKKPKISKDRARMLNSAIAYLRFKGFHEIKAPQEGFNDPRAVFRKASEAGYTPDVIAEKKFGTYLFEIVEQDEIDQVDAKAEKWEVFDEYCKRKKGRFYLITYSDCAETLTERIDTMAIDPGMIKIKN